METGRIGQLDTRFMRFGSRLAEGLRTIRTRRVVAASVVLAAAGSTWQYAVSPEVHQIKEQFVAAASAFGVSSPGLGTVQSDALRTLPEIASGKDGYVALNQVLDDTTGGITVVIDMQVANCAEAAQNAKRIYGQYGPASLLGVIEAGLSADTGQHVHAIAYSPQQGDCAGVS
jgi:hypothetical protein